MKIILTKSAEIMVNRKLKKFPIGQKMDVTPEIFKDLGDAAKQIDGPMVTGKKVKTEFFKPNKTVKPAATENEIAQPTKE